jgi:ankyrin repeat domain-containing protein 50
MAEFGVAASMVGIISFGIQIAQGLLRYYGSWRDQDGNVADMCASLDSLSRTLAVLSETFQRHDLPNLSIQKRVVESVDCVNIAMKKLEDELKKVQNISKTGVRTVMRRHVRRALYPFKEETLQKIRSAISEARSDLNLTLQVLHMLVYLGLIHLVLS